MRGRHGLYEGRRPTLRQDHEFLGDDLSSGMLRMYLLVNAVLYVLFAVWCTVMPGKTAEVLGLTFRSGSGKSEYITVYGGLEFGVAMFFLLAAMRPEMRQAGLLFALLFYGGLVAWRIPTLLLVPGVHRVTYGFAATEAVLLGMAVLLKVFNVTR
jgi:hypothetical protein